MKLIGQFDSPFVRRVGLTLELYHIPYTHLPLSVYHDMDEVAGHNPLIRVPCLVLEGASLFDSHLIIDYLDHLVSDAIVLTPRLEPSRHQVLRIVALAAGVVEKGLALFYERQFHSVTSSDWQNRLRLQIMGTLERLNQERAKITAPYWVGDKLSQADIMMVCAFRYMGDVHGAYFDLTQYPHLQHMCAGFEASPLFQKISQAFRF